MLTKAELAAIRVLSRSAYELPWKIGDTSQDIYANNGEHVASVKLFMAFYYAENLVHADCERKADENTAYIVSTCNSIPALLDHIKELEAKLQRARDYARAAADFSVPFRTHGRGRWTDMIELLQEEDEK